MYVSLRNVSPVLLLTIVPDAEFSDTVKEFLRCFEYAGIKDLKDIISWNHTHAERALIARKLTLHLE